MRTSQAARYARTAAFAALVLAAIVAGIYGVRAWQAHLAEQKAPPAVPPTVQQRSAGFSFSKVEQERTLFTVRASRATEFKEGNRNLLEDVWITIYGRTGQRFDNFHTQACDYLSATGRIVCAGEVQIDLESAEEAQQRPGERVIHIATSQVSFDRESGEARTDQPVVFRFPDGEGRGAGVVYRSRDGWLRLQRNVELTLRMQNQEASGGSAEPVALTGDSLEYRRDTHTLRLAGPVRGRQGRRELAAGELALELDADLRAQRLMARSGGSGQPELRATQPAEQESLAANELVAHFHRAGWTERLLAKGNVRGSRKASTGEERLEADQLDVELLPRESQPREVTARGHVLAQAIPAQPGGESRRLETAALRLTFAAAAKTGERRLDRAETLAPATVELEGPSAAGGKSARQVTRFRGRQLFAQFGERGEMKSLTARDAVEVVRQWPGRPPQVTTSRELAAKFGAGGGWAEMEQSGNVQLREGARTGQADRARYERAADRVTLTGGVVLADPTTRTTAQSVWFVQRTGEISAQGDVRSTDSSRGRNAIVTLAPEPAHISSDRLLANSSTGRAVYSGRARLWQGDAVIEGDSIELVRDARLLNARGNVLAVFPQASGAPGKSSPANKEKPAEPDAWRVRAGTMTYWGGEARAWLEQGVNAVSRRAQITSRALEAFFSSAESPAGGAPGSAAGPGAAAGAQQLTRAVATGGVTVRQGGRRGASERAEYFAVEGKFVLSGGRPTLYDASRGTTTGRQLTFFYADDTIIVDSEEGSRPRARPRVEK